MEHQVRVAYGLDFDDEPIDMVAADEALPPEDAAVEPANQNL